MDEEEEEFDGEKTQFWLPGQALPGRPAAGNATGDAEGLNLPKSPQRRQQAVAPKTPADTAGDGTIDFDLTGEGQADGTGLDFDLTAEAETGADTMDFDITGEGAIPPESKPEPASDASKPAPAAAVKPAPAVPSPESSSVSGGTLLLVVVIAIAGAVIYFLTR